MEFGMRETLITIVLFSVFVIVMDEIIHARRRRKREREGGGPTGH